MFDSVANILGQISVKAFMSVPPHARLQHQHTHIHTKLTNRPPLIIWSVFSRGSVVRVLNSKNYWDEGKFNPRKITSVLCLWAALCETIWSKHANSHWWAWLEWISKANKPRERICDSPLVNPPQLNHHRWKKHTMYPNDISDKAKQSTIAK